MMLYRMSSIDIDALGTTELYKLLHKIISVLENRTMESECVICFENKPNGSMCRVCRNSWCIVCDLKLLVSAFKSKRGTFTCPCCRNVDSLFRDVIPSKYLETIQNRVDKALLDDIINVDEANEIYKMFGNGTKVEVFEE